MSDASISTLGRWLRTPWYAFWRWLERLFYADKEYSLQIPQGQRIYTPWFHPQAGTPFAKALHGMGSRGDLVVSPDRCYLLFQMATRAGRLPGEFAECGVYTGGTAELLAGVLRKALESDSQSDGKAGGASARKLHLFDTFEGMPEGTEAGRDYHSPGDFSDTSEEAVRQRLRAFEDLCAFHVGVMPATFQQVPQERYSFVHVDVDIYPSALECCRWFWPRLVPGGVMVFDDYGFYPYRHAARAAVDEFFADQVEAPIALPTGQAIVFKDFSAADPNAQNRTRTNSP
ncbi:MAG: TylF/MycF family methyltransferase [Deltaproteobacteria bacterium]|nr:TylF/MycF family methyltransferase [Deltaproteobacteria bacterium]